MFPIPWFVVLLVSIPESFLVILLGFALFNLKISVKNIIIIALAGSFACYLIRLFNTINGIQTMGWIFIMIICSFILSKISIWKIVVAVLSGVTIAGVIQSLYAPICFMFTSTSKNDLITDPWLNVWFTLPEFIVIIILYFVIKKTHFVFNGNMEDTRIEKV